MHSTRKSSVWQQAKQLFHRLRSNLLSFRSGCIRVVYCERFPAGECVIGMTIPLVEGKLRTAVSVAMAQQHYHYEPAIITCDGKPTSLRLMYRFPTIEPGEIKRILSYSHMLGEWAEELFGMRAIVSPGGGLINVRRRLRAFSPAC